MHFTDTLGTVPYAIRVGVGCACVLHQRASLTHFLIPCAHAGMGLFLKPLHSRAAIVFAVDEQSRAHMREPALAQGLWHWLIAIGAGVLSSHALLTRSADMLAEHIFVMVWHAMPLHALRASTFEFSRRTYWHRHLPILLRHSRSALLQALQARLIDKI